MLKETEMDSAKNRLNSTFSEQILDWRVYLPYLIIYLLKTGKNPVSGFVEVQN